MVSRRSGGWLCMLSVVGLVLSACAGSGGARDPDDRRYVERGLTASEQRSAQGRSVGASAMDRPPVMLRGEAISWDTLLPRLGEAAGALAVEEVVLERLLEGECARAGIRLTPEMLERERDLLVSTMGEAAGATTAQEAERLLDRVRRERGVGPVRFESQLRRSAMLRALVQDQVSLTEEALRLGYELRYGRAYRVRVIVVGTAREASAAVRRTRAGESFGEVAAMVSTDDSAARGGIIDPINLSDTSWPESIRRIVGMLEPGGISEPVSVDQGYAIVRLDEVIPAPADRPSFEEARTSLVREVRLRQEQLLMARLARRLLDEAEVRVLDPSLGWTTR